MSSDPSMAFARALIQLRRQLGITQTELAERAGLNTSTVGALERGRRRTPPALYTYRALRDAFLQEPRAGDVQKLEATWEVWNQQELGGQEEVNAPTPKQPFASGDEAIAHEGHEEGAERQAQDSRATGLAPASHDAQPPASDREGPRPPTDSINVARAQTQGTNAAPDGAPANEQGGQRVAQPHPSAAVGRRVCGTKKWHPAVAAGLSVILVSAAVVAMVRGILAPGQQSALSPGSPLAPVRIEGNLAAAVQLTAQSTGLGFVDPATGAVLSLPLVPEEQAKMHSYISPAYTPSKHLLAFIAIAANGTHSVWMTQLRVAPSSAPQIVKPGPLKLAANCGQACNTLAISPSGNWLIVEGLDGLVAINTQTGEQHTITHGSHDAGPACSPTGAWLTYQYGVGTAGYIVAVPAVDCLPIAGAAGRVRVLSGYILAWDPTWSVDGTHVAFMEKSPQGARVYAVDVSALARGGSVSDVQLSPGPISENGCSDPVWATTAQPPQNVLLYTCSSQSGSQLVVASGSDLSHRQVVPGGPNGAEQTLDNLAWIPPETT